MSAAVMSNYYFAPPGGQRFVADTRYPLQNWMFAQMAQYPPPPQPDQQHYNALYPANAGAQQLLDPQDHLQYNNLNQALYPKVETTAAEQASSNHQIHNLTQDLHQHVAINEQQSQNIHQASHPPHQQTIHGQQSTNSQASQSSSHQGTPDQTQKANRLRKACDSCSIRKVKCDESGPPCRACTALDIPCTFERPSRRRGPPNRHAEALKRRRLDEATDSSHLSPPTSPTHAAQALAALSAQTSSQQLSAESICPIEILDSLIDDFFTYIHPLCPFPHEPSFREAWRRREDLSNNGFLALLASMIGALVSSLPRKPRLRLKSQRRENAVPNYSGIVNQCQKVCNLARGPGYLGNDNLSVYDAATSYFMGLTALYTFRWRHTRLYFGECLTILKVLGLHKVDEQTQTQLGRLPASVGSHGTDNDGSRSQAFDNITLQMGHRIFWTLYIAIRNMQQVGAAFDELTVQFPTSSDTYPPLPAEVDDFCIYPAQTNAQPDSTVPLIAGFNSNASLFRLQDSLAGEHPVESLGDNKSRPNVLKQLARSGFMDNTDKASALKPPRLSRDPATTLMNDPDHSEDIQASEQRKHIQQEIQRANILVSSLSMRAHIVESYWKLREADGLSTTPSRSHAIPRNEYEMQREREAIAMDVLTALVNMSEINIEPSADNFAVKVRRLAGELLDVPDSRKAQLTLAAKEDLASFLNDLTILESEPSSNGDDATHVRAWNDLRQRQARLLQAAAQ